MIAFDEALALLAQAVRPLGCETVQFAEAAGRTLAEDLRARADSPPAPTSAMDGYAVIEAATDPGQPLLVIGESRAGAGFDGAVGAGEAVRIFTGARLPAGADCVVIQEYAAGDGDTVRFAEGYGPARHVRPRGGDFAAGDVLVPAGTRLGPRAMVAAAAADRGELSVVRRARVAIVATGDELADPGHAHLRADAIPESVSHGVAAMVAGEGGEVIARFSGADELPALVEIAARALDAANLVVVTGGASVGERDFAKPMFAAHGLETLFSKVAIKPGKPVWLGTARGTLVLGLPGNPTSAMVTAALFLRPILARLHHADGAHRWRHLPLAAPLPATEDRETFVRARWDDAGLMPLSNQDSGAQGPLLGAEWLIRCPPHQPALAQGTPVAALAF